MQLTFILFLVVLFSQFPSQVACVLNSPFLQHVLSCNPDFVMLQRLNFWLNHSLYEGNVYFIYLFSTPNTQVLNENGVLFSK